MIVSTPNPWNIAPDGRWGRNYWPALSAGPCCRGISCHRPGNVGCRGTCSFQVAVRFDFRLNRREAGTVVQKNPCLAGRCLAARGHVGFADI